MENAPSSRQAFWQDPERLLLLLVVACGVVAGVLFASVSPDGRAPDEYRYIEDVLSVTTAGGWRTVTGHPPLYPALGALVRALVPWGDVWHYVMRLLGALAVGVTVFATYLASRELFPERPLARWLPPLLVAFLPQFGFIAASVNSDGMLAAECAVVFYLLLRSLRRGLSKPAFVWLVVLSAVGVLTKQRFLVLVPVEIVVLVVVVVRGLRHRRTEVESGSRASTVSPALLVAGFGMLALVGLAFLVWAPPIEPSRLLQALAPSAAARIVSLPYFPVDLFTSFWGYFDWLGVPMHQEAYLVYLALSVLATVGLLIAAVRAVARSGIRAALRGPSFQAWALVIGTLLLSVYSVVLYQVGGLAAQGRYLFIAIVPFALAFGGGIDALVPPRVARWAFASCVLVLAGTFFVEVAFRLMPYYY